MLRHPGAVSEMSDFLPGTKFKETYCDEYADAKKVKRVLLCSGKIYYDLLEKQQTDGRKDVAILRVEQLHPFPKKQIEELLGNYTKAETIWVQEEPQNMGAWSFILREFPEIGIDDVISRKKSASPATGYTKYHQQGQANIVEKAFDLTKKEKI